MVIIFTTIHKKEIALKIGRALLQNRLIACFNLSPIQSAYWWKGKILEERETLMILKTRQENFEKIEKVIDEQSGYEVPELIAIKPSKVNKKYLQWVKSESK